MTLKTIATNAAAAIASVTKRRTTADIVKGFTSGITDLLAHAEAQSMRVGVIDTEIETLIAEAEAAENDAVKARRIAAKLEDIFA